MVRIFILMLALGTAFSISAQGPLITEFHYDDVYSSPQDSFEFVEVYLPDPQPTNLDDYHITLYQGSDNPPIALLGSIHRQKRLGEAILTGDTPNGMYYVVEFPDTMYLGFIFGGIENGPDGICFSGPGGEVYKFLSYEGVFTATEGPANGMTSTQTTSGNGTSGTPVQENNSTPTTNSLQQNGFDAWTYNVPFSLAAENTSDSGTGFPGNLPVNLNDYQVTKSGSDVLIEWSTAQEHGNEKFVVEHSRDGLSFSRKFEMPGAGNTSYQVNYRKMDKNVSDGLHYYRLVQYDYSGRKTYLGTKTVSINKEKNLKIYPTNAVDYLNVENHKYNAEFSIYSLQGFLMNQGVIENGIVNTSELPVGNYWIQVGDEKIRFNKL